MADPEYPSTPVLRLDMDEGTGASITDEGSAGATGTIVNSYSWITGKIGSGALRFVTSPTMTYVTLNEEADFRITGSMSISMWIYAYSYGGTSGSFIISKSSSTSNNRCFILDISASTGYVTLSRGDGSVSQGVATTTALPLNRWVHLVVVDDSKTVSIYFDKNLVGYGSYTLTPTPSTGISAYIGAIYSYVPNSARYLDAALDDLVLYSRALTTEEIATLYANALTTISTTKTFKYKLFNNVSVNSTGATLGDFPLPSQLETPETREARCPVLQSVYNIINKVKSTVKATYRIGPKIWVGSGNASTAANWSDNEAPQAGDDILFNSTSTSNCTWDITTVVGNILMDTGYTGTITNTTNVNHNDLTIRDGVYTVAGGALTQSTYGDFLLAGGTYNGNSATTCHHYGNWTKTGGTYGTKGQLSMRSNDTTIWSNDNVALTHLGFRASVSIVDSPGIFSCETQFYLISSSSDTLTIDNSTIRLIDTAVSANMVYTGTWEIIGLNDGILQLYIYTSRTLDADFALITKSVDLEIVGADGQTAAAELELGQDISVGQTHDITIYTDDDAETFYADTNNYNITCHDLTILTRGYLKYGTSSAYIYGSFDCYTGIAAMSSGHVYMMTSGETIKIKGYTNRIRYLHFVPTGGTFTLDMVSGDTLVIDQNGYIDGDGCTFGIGDCRIYQYTAGATVCFQGTGTIVGNSAVNSSGYYFICYALSPTGFFTNMQQTGWTMQCDIRILAERSMTYPIEVTQTGDLSTTKNIYLYSAGSYGLVLHSEGYDLQSASMWWNTNWTGSVTIDAAVGASEFILSGNLSIYHGYVTLNQGLSHLKLQGTGTVSGGLLHWYDVTVSGTYSVINADGWCDHSRTVTGSLDQSAGYNLWYRMETPNPLTVKWKITQAMAPSKVKATWRILGRISATEKMIWNMRNTIKTSDLYEWSLYNRIQSSDKYMWGIRKIVSNKDKFAYNINGRVSGTREFIYNNYVRIGVARKLVYALRKPLSGDSEMGIRYTIRRMIGDSRNPIGMFVLPGQLETVYFPDESSNLVPTYSVRTRISPSYDKSVWNIKRAINSSNKQIWSIYNRIMSFDKHVWNIINKVEAHDKYVYNIRNRTTPSSRKTIWNVRNIIGTSDKYIWSIRNRISTTDKYLWKIRNYVSNKDELYYRILGRVPSTKKLVYSVRNITANKRRVDYGIRGTLRVDNDFVYSIRRMIGDYRDPLGAFLIPMQLESANPDESVALIPTYHLLNKLAPGHNEQAWNIRKTIDSSDKYVWNTRNLIKTADKYIWNNRNFVSTTDKYVYRILGRTVSKNKSVYDIRNIITNKNKILYDINGILTATSTVSYTIRRIIGDYRNPLGSMLLPNQLESVYVPDQSSNLIPTYHIRNLLSPSTDEFVWDINKSIGTSDKYVYSIRNYVFTTDKYVWNVRNLVSVYDKYVWSMWRKIGTTDKYVYSTRNLVANSRKYLYNINGNLVVSRRIAYTILKKIGDYRNPLGGFLLPGALEYVDNPDESVNLIPTYSARRMILSDEPILCMPLNQDSGLVAFDHSGYNRHGILTADMWDTGVLGDGVYFDGTTGEYIEIPNDGLNPGKITVSAWIKPIDDTVVMRMFVSAGRDSYTSGYNFMTYGPYLRVLIDTGTVLEESSDNVTLSSSACLTMGEWHHVAMTYDENYLIIYCNGIEVGRTASKGDITYYYDTPVVIGLMSMYRTTTKYFKFYGHVDEVRIYDYAMSVDEIRRHADGDYYAVRNIEPWNIRKLIGTTDKHVWSIRNYVSVSDKYIWSVYNFRSASKKMIYNVRGLAKMNLKSIWNIRNIISSHDKIIWNILGPLYIKIGVAYNVRELVHDFRRPLGAFLIPSQLESVGTEEPYGAFDDIHYHIRENVSPSYDKYIYHIREMVPASYDKYVYRILNIVRYGMKFVWNVRNLVREDIQFRFNLLGRCMATSKLMYRIMNRAGASAKFVYGLQGKLVTFLTTMYSIRELVHDFGRPLGGLRLPAQLESIQTEEPYGKVGYVAYNIRGIVARKDDLVYHIRQFISPSGATMIYGILDHISISKSLVYNVREMVHDHTRPLGGFRLPAQLESISVHEGDGTVMIPTWNIFQPAVNQFIMGYKIFNYTSADIETSYSIYNYIRGKATVLYRIQKIVKRRMIPFWHINIIITSNAFDFMWKIRNYVSVEKEFVWNIRTSPCGVLKMMYSARNTITDSILIKYNMRALTSQKSLRMIYGVRFLLDPSDVDLSYRITKKVYISDKFIYNIRNRIRTTDKYIYRILKKVLRSNRSRYNIRGIIVSGRLLKFHIREVLGTEIDFVYDINERISVPVKIVYNTRNFVRTHDKYLYNVRKSIGSTRKARYNIRGWLGSSVLVPEYSIREVVSTDSVVLYNLLGKTRATCRMHYSIYKTIGKKTGTRYNIRNIVADMFSPTYSIRLRIDQGFTAEYDILGRLRASTAFRYSILKKISAKDTLRYSIRNHIVRDIDTMYRIRGLIESSNEFTYRILESIGTINTTSYNILGLVSSINSTKYNIRNIVFDSMIPVYHVRGSVPAMEIISIYNIRKSIYDTLTDVYNVINKVPSTVRYRWNIFPGSPKVHATDPYNRIRDELYDYFKSLTVVGGDFEGFIVYKRRPINDAMFTPCIIIDILKGEFDELEGEEYGEGCQVLVEAYFKHDKSVVLGIFG